MALTLAPSLLGLLVASVTAAQAPASPAAPEGTVARAAEELAARAVEGLPPGPLALQLAACPDPLREPVATALEGALVRRGQVVVLRPGPSADGEAQAAAAGADALLRVRAAVTPGALALSGELIGTRANFFLQRAPAARAAAPRLLSAAAPLDPATRALAGLARPGLGPLTLRPLAELPGPVLALGLGATRAGGPPRLVAFTPAALLLLDARGAVLDRRVLPPPAPGPRVRDPAAVVVVGDLRGLGVPGRVDPFAPRIAWSAAGRPDGELLTAEGDRLTPVRALPLGPGAQAPLAAGPAGRLFGAWVPGRGALADLLVAEPDPAARPRSGRELWAVAAAPAPGDLAWAVLGADATAALLGPALDRRFPDVRGVGPGLCLADLLAEGTPALVAPGLAPGPGDSLRVLRPGVEGAAFEAGVEGAVTAGAAGDLTGDGVDDAVVASALPGGRARLWMLTADAAGVAP